MFISAPAANALAAVFSNRVVIIVGSMFTAFGFIIVCFAENITTVIIFMGFFVGELTRYKSYPPEFQSY